MKTLKELKESFSAVEGHGFTHEGFSLLYDYLADVEELDADPRTIAAEYLQCRPDDVADGQQVVASDDSVAIVVR